MLYRKEITIFIFFLGILIASVGNAEESNWTKSIDKNGIEVYKRSIEGSSIKEVKSVAYVQAPFNLVISLHENDKLYGDWCHRCKTIKVIERINPQEKIVYYQTDSPWPVADRDSYSHHKKVIDPKTKSVSFLITDYSQNYPLEEGRVRITEQWGMWRFTPLDNGIVELYYQQYVDIGGSIPKWLVNQTIASVPYHSLKNFRKLIKDSQK